MNTGAIGLGVVDCMLLYPVNVSAGNFVNIFAPETIGGGACTCVTGSAAAVAMGVLVDAMTIGSW